jgi:hypothetical protein
VLAVPELAVARLVLYSPLNGCFNKQVLTVLYNTSTLLTVGAVMLPL